MALLLSALLVAALSALVWSVMQVTNELRRLRSDARRQRARQVLALFAPGVVTAPHDARALLAWEPVARTARRLLPDEFAVIDGAMGQAFPFSRQQVDQVHARWTADWLEWEQTHTTVFKVKVAEAEAELRRDPSSPLGRARLDAVEREKLELYQARYGQYVQVAKALQALMTEAPK